MAPDPTIYLDNAATSWPKPPEVAAEMARFLADDAANPGRGDHRMALAAGRAVENVRARLTRLFDADHVERTIFCASCTDALNAAIKGVLREGDHVVTTQLEHNSVARPLRRMADGGFISVTWVAVNKDGFIGPDEIAKAIRRNTRLVAVTHASNVTGLIQPIEDIGRIARERGAILLVDAAQTAGVLDISMKRARIDLLVVPGHKSLLGPMGTGALIVGERADPRPWREGGTGGDSATPVQPSEYPHVLEAGTPNAVGIAGWGAALAMLDSAATLAHERRLCKRMADGLAVIRGVHILGDPDPERRVGTLSFTVESMSPQEAAAVLDQEFNIAVRAGLHCAPMTHKAMGTFPDGTIRASAGRYNTEAEIDEFLRAIGEIAMT